MNSLYFQKTITMRKKEGLADYRYFPEPDLPGVSISNDYVENIRVSLPELPEMKRRRYEEMGLSMQDVLFLTNDVTVSLVDHFSLFAIPEPVLSLIYCFRLQNFSIKLFQ